MEVKYIAKDDIYKVKERLSYGMTLEMIFSEVDYNCDTETIYYNISLSVYHKRKQIDDNEANFKLTGLNPFETFVTAKNAYELIEKTLKEEEPYDNLVFIANPTDSKRRDTYEKFLKKYDFHFDFYGGKKILMKKINKKIERCN